MAESKIGVVLINLGTPDSPSVPDVRKYLREFLMDARVIDIPVVQRSLLVNGIIAPFRAPQSAKEYSKLWTSEGSPLKTYGLQLTKLVQEALGSEFVVTFGMRYQSPSLESALDVFKVKPVKELIVIPLYPQYASASSGSTIELLFDLVKQWQLIPSIKTVNQFADHPLFIETFAQLGRMHMNEFKYDHILFSYHGLPERQILKGSVHNYCQIGDCCNVYHDRNRYCYRAQCFLTSRLLAKALGLSPEQYTVCFQSRLGKDPWVKPYTDEVIVALAKRSVKSILTFSPAFVADCLETTVEIGETYQELFLEHGGERWQLVESLNVHPQWVECLVQLILQNSGVIQSSNAI